MPDSPDGGDGSSGTDTPEQRQQTIRQMQRHFHDQIGARTESAVADLNTRWQSVRATLDEQIAQLTTAMRKAQDAGDSTDLAWLTRAREMAELKASVMGNVGDFANEAAALSGDAMYDALDLGQGAAQALLAANVPPGLAYTFGVPPSDVLDAAAGALQPGSPLQGVFDSFASDAWQFAQQALFTAIALGGGAEVAAERLEWATNMPLQRATVIARTEIHRAWRGAQMANYRANSDVVQQWMWACDFGPRSCFPAGTLVQTRRGLIPIEQVRVGDEALTHRGRYRRVTETLRRDYSGEMVTLAAGDQQVTATSDHPFLAEWQGQLNWIEAANLTLGARVVCQRQRGAQVGDHRLGQRPIEGRVGQAHHTITQRLQAQRLARVLRLGLRRAMPVHAVDLQHGVVVRQVEVSRVAPARDGIFLHEGDAHLLQTLARPGLWLRLTRVAAIALRRAEAHRQFTRRDAPLFAAGQARRQVRRATALLGAIASIRLTPEDHTTAHAGMQDVPRVARMALARAVVALLGLAGVDLQRLAADGADDFQAAACLVAGPRTVDAIGVTGQRGEGLTTLNTGTQFTRTRTSRASGAMWRSALMRGIAGARAEAPTPTTRPGVRDGKGLLTFATNLFHVTSIAQSDAHIQSNGTVYNLEVDEDHSYVAGGFVVHNCGACIALDGTTHTLDEDFDDHICGRCSALPITLPWAQILGDAGMSQQQIADLGLTGAGETSAASWAGLAEGGVFRTRETGSEWFGRQDAETQNRILGPAAAQAWRAGDVTLNDFVGYKESPTWGTSIYQKSLREMDLDASAYLAETRANGTDSVVGAEVTPDTNVQPLTPDQFAQQQADALNDPAAIAARKAAADTWYADVQRSIDGITSGTVDDWADAHHGLDAWYDQVQSAIAAGEPIPIYDWNIRREEAIAVAEGRASWISEGKPGAAQSQEPEGFALKEPSTAAAGAAALTRDDLSFKSMADLRQIASDAGVKPARSKAETIDRILAAQPKSATAPASATEAAAETAATPAVNEKLNAKLVELRARIDERMAQREDIYAQQGRLVAQKDRLYNQQHAIEFNIKQGHPEWNLEDARYRAEIDLYHQRLDPTDPEVKQYFKDLAARDKAQVERFNASMDQQRAEQRIQQLESAGQKGSAAWTQARADYQDALARQEKAGKAEERARDNLRTRSPGVYKPELDSIAGVDASLSASGAARSHIPAGRGGVVLTDEEINSHPLVEAERARIARMPTLITEVDAKITALEPSIKALNTQITRDLTRLSKLNAELGVEVEAADTLRPFSDVIDLPEGHQPPNALMNKLDYQMREPRSVTKRRIIDDIHQRLKDNPDWKEYVDRASWPSLGVIYHAYIGDYATAADTKSAQLVADWIKKWGVGYRPGSPQWVAMQRAANDEFGLGARIHISAAQFAAGEQFYAENGAALRGLMRAMYDNTQQWFTEQGITDIDLYRGMGFSEGAAMLPQGITWGPLDAQNYGVTDQIEFNPFQSFSADINISQGTKSALGGGGFAGGGFGGGGAYSLLVGARVPVERILATAQTGFGAKLESEVVVMGRATDSVSYRAGTSVASALVREADEQNVAANEIAYRASDGTQVNVVANADGTYTATLVSGRDLTSQWIKVTDKSGSSSDFKKVGINLKVGKSKTYKTADGVNNLLKAARLSNTYTPPALELGLREDEAAALTGEAASDALHAQIEQLPSDATAADAQDFLQQHLSDGARVDLMPLDAQAARLVANSLGNLLSELPAVADNLASVAVQATRDGALAMVSPDGASLLLNPDKWADLAGLAERAPLHAESGWWVATTPEQMLGHELGHAVQLNYGISDQTWQAALDRVAAESGNPYVSDYARSATAESFAETFALLVYGQPSEAQLPIAREMAMVLRDNGLDYAALRAAVGAPPLDLSK